MPVKRHFCLVLIALLPLVCRGASVTFQFQPAPGVAPDYAEVNVWLLADEACAYWEKARKWQTLEKSFTHTFDQLTPGDYYYLVFTGPYAQRRLARPGAFSTSIRGLELPNAAARETISIEYQPLTNFTAHHGPGSRSGRVVDLDGQPLGERVVRLGLITPERKGDGLYAFATVTTGSDGRFTFTNVSPAVGAAALDEDFDFLGRLEPDKPLLITNKSMVGRRAPDFAFTGLGDGREWKLSEFTGKPVVLEYWASTCGPCQAPMTKFEALYQAHPTWRGRVELIAVSLDHKEETARQHIAKKAWKHTRHVWGGTGAWDAPAAKALHVGSIPCLFVLDGRGTVVAQGDPRSVNLQEAVRRVLGAR
jgi:thiol-disulfide isomerase/thioredoxin